MKQPIGIIDSGVGGLTVAKEVMRQLPNESILYVGDTARCPYGPRPVHEVQRFTWQMTNYLLSKQIKMLIIACNTATAVTLHEIRSRLTIPVIGVIHPGARTALKTTKNGHIGVIGTVGTIRSKAYVHALKEINRNVKIVSLPCPKFVPLVESGEYQGSIAKKIVAETLMPLKGSSIDTLILGCTHYPLLGPLISNYMGPNVSVISSGEETAREASTILSYHGMLNESDEPPTYQFFTTGSAPLFAKIATDWLHINNIDVTTIHLGKDIRS
ncbi:glutamate racemase [Aeribacillus pallidus]|uniref:glutamate racemase n=1 Tax=Aeribacillus pallidus TaxID=33936 RepID=UPI001DECEE55|nr:glutamate racemase [Bacillus sp. (in: firmicutes)]